MQASELARKLLFTGFAIVLGGCGKDPAPGTWNVEDRPAAQTNGTAMAPAESEQPLPEDDSGIQARGSEAASGSGKWWAALPRAEWAEFEQVSLRDNWFEVYRVAEGIFAIYEPGQFEEVISYLVVGEQQALLFDTGLGIGNILGVVKQLTSLPVSVLNSHSHYDHVGGNYQFDTIAGRNHPYARERSRGLSNDQVGAYALGDWIWKTTPTGFVPREYATRGWEYSRWIREGQFIDLGGVSLEVIYAPGHSPDSLVLVDHQRRLMFTGDTFYLAPLYTHTESASFPDYAATAARLAGLRGSVDTLLMSHNTPRASSDYLEKLDAAFQAILQDAAPYILSEGAREYRFEDFSILTPDPPNIPDAEIELL